MNRLVKALGNLAVAASAATALFVSASRPARAQDPAIPALRDQAKATQDEITRKRLARQLAAQAVIDAEAAAVRRVALGPGFGVNAANRDEAIRVGIQKLRPTLRMELRLLAEAAEPTPSQRITRRDRRPDPAKGAQDEVTRRKIAAMNQGQVLVVPMAGAQPPANRDEAIQQGLRQLRPVLRMELRLLTEAAGPTPSQRREIAIEAGRTLRQNVENLANNQFNQPARMVSALYSPRKLVHQHLELAAWPRLSNVQSARYRAEQERKEQARREVVVLNVVATIDKHLCLNARQRDKLCESLRLHWDDRDYPPDVTSIDYDKYVAIVPDLYMIEILGEDQLKVWRGLRKYHLAASAVRTTVPPLNNLAIGVEADDADEDEDVKAALGVEVKK